MAGESSSAATPASGLWTGLPRRSLWFDLGAAVLLVLVALPVALSQGIASVLALIVLGVALALRRLSPGVALAVAWVGAVVQMATVSDPGLSDAAILGVLYATAAYGTRLVRWLGLASAIAGAVISTAYLVLVQPALRGAATSTVGPLAEDGARTWFVLLFFSVAALALLGLSWTLGLLVRTVRLSRAARIEARILQERVEYEVVVEQERTRIARDMHDVVAHSLAVVIAQADGARYASAADPAAQSAALVTIAGTARAALGDVRLLLAELRHDAADGPQPVLADIDRLVEQMRQAGMPIEVDRAGEPVPLGAGHEIAAYRIVQEALTNALRHGRGGAPVTLRLDWTPEGLGIAVENAVVPADRPAPAPAPAGPAVGHGLPGMRERAALAGGSLTAELHGEPPERFAVHAVIPAAAAAGGMT